MNFCNFIQQRLRADDFQIPPHRQAVSVISHFYRNHLKRSYLIAIIGFTLSYSLCAQNPKTSTKERAPTIDSSRNPNFSQRIPQPIGRTSDFVGLFSKSETESLDSLISAYEKKTTVEFAIVTVDSSMIGDIDFEAYALSMLRTWGIGKRGKDNGILILIAADMRRIRIENGYGIEKVLTNEETKAVIDTIIIPYFKEAKFFQGTKEGILAIIKKVEKNGL